MDLFVDRSTNTIMPLMKFCLYELRRVGGDVGRFEDIEEDLVIEAESTETGLVRFRDQDVKVDSKDLKVLLVKIQGVERDYAEFQRDDDFVCLFSCYDDAAGIVTAESNKLHGMKAGPSVDAQKLKLRYILGYIKHEKLKLSMGRTQDRIKACDPAKHRDLAHLYDALLQEAETVLLLPGPEEEDEFSLEANAEILRIRAFRAFHVAHLYAETGRTLEALSMLQKATLLAGRATEEIAACERLPGQDAKREGLEVLSKNVRGSTVRVKAQAFSNSSRHPSDLLNGVDTFEARQSFVALRIKPIPAKPSFFDVTWNEISGFPAQALQKQISSMKPKKGLLGWLSATS